MTTYSNDRVTERGARLAPVRNIDESEARIVFQGDKHAYTGREDAIQIGNMLRRAGIYCAVDEQEARVYVAAKDLRAALGVR